MSLRCCVSLCVVVFSTIAGCPSTLVVISYSDVSCVQYCIFLHVLVCQQKSIPIYSYIPVMLEKLSIEPVKYQAMNILLNAENTSN
jgi:hypothetical protein